MTSSRRSAFSLVEVTMALGVAAFALLAVFGLLPIALQTSAAATQQTSASNILAAVVSDLRAAGNSAASSPMFSIPIPSNSASSTTERFFTGHGKSSDTPTWDSRYRLAITFEPNASGLNAATFAHVVLSWPAMATATSASGSIESFVALDRK